MKKYLVSLLVVLASGTLCAKDNPTKPLERAIESGELSKVKKEFKRFDAQVDSTNDKKKYLNELVEVAQDIVDESPTQSAQPSRLKSIAKRTAKLVGGTVLTGIGQVGVGFSAISLVTWLKDIDDDEDDRTFDSPPAAICVGSTGIFLSAGIAGLGAWLFNKGMTDSSSVASSTDAEAIVEFLEEELDAL